MPICCAVVWVLLSAISYAEHSNTPNPVEMRREEDHAQALAKFDKLVAKEPFATMFHRSRELKGLRRVLQEILTAKNEQGTKDLAEFLRNLQHLFEGEREDRQAVLTGHLATELGWVAVASNEGRLLYEQENDGAAKKMLKTFYTHSDPNLLATLAIEFPFTQSGLEALELLATFYLDRGRYDLASFYFDLFRSRQERLRRPISPLTQYKFILSRTRSGQELDWEKTFDVFAKNNPNGIFIGNQLVTISHLKEFLSKSVTDMYARKLSPAVTLLTSRDLPSIASGLNSLPRPQSRRNDIPYLTVYKIDAGAQRFFKMDPFLEADVYKTLTALEKKGHFEFIELGPATFWMGSPTTEKGREVREWRHKVTLTKPFQIQSTEVTQELWEAIMGANQSLYQGKELPVNGVSWRNITEEGGFLDRLNARMADTPYFYRLPTEAEWEFAARGGKDTAYSFGSDVARLGRYAWYQSNSRSALHLVRRLTANNYGLYDMHGNILEWVQDSYEPDLEKLPSTDPQAKGSSNFYSARGGSYMGIPSMLRSAARFSFSPEKKTGYMGFRLVRVRRDLAGPR